MTNPVELHPTLSPGSQQRSAPASGVVVRPKVIIVGAGLVGLATAVGLRSFCDVTVLESMSHPAEVGAALGIGSNAHKILEKWGVQMHARYGAIIIKKVANWDGLRGGEKLFEAVLRHREDYGSDHVQCVRQDVQTELIRLATENSEYPPCQLIFGQKVVKVNCDAGEVETDEGRKFVGDVVIGADGLHSRIRPFILNSPPPPLIPSPHSCYRMLIPACALTSDPLISSLEILDDKVTIADGDQVRIVCYPTRKRTVVNAIAMVPNGQLREESRFGWEEDGKLEPMLESFKNWDEPWRRFLSNAKEIGLWKLQDIDPLDRWVNGRVMIIGDAAHAMLPHQGQGFGQGIEDAEAVVFTLRSMIESLPSSTILPDTTPSLSLSTINTALLRAFNIRHARATRVQKLSRRMGPPLKLPDGTMEERLPFNEIHKNRAYAWTYEGAEEWEGRQRRGEEPVEAEL